MARNIQVNMLKISGYIGNAACAWQPQSRVSAPRPQVVSPKCDVVEIPLGVDLSRAEEFFWAHAGQDVSYCARKTDIGQSAVQPQSFYLDQAQRRRVATNALPDSGDEI